MTTLNTNFTIEDGQLYLCYYDPDNDQLKELNEGNVKLKILPKLFSNFNPITSP